jgi:hypothetical protein
MDLQLIFKQAQEELDKQKQELVSKGGELLAKEQDLKDADKALKDKTLILAEKEQSLADRESKVAGIENSQEEVKRLSDLRTEANSAFQEARAQEDRLVEIKVSLDQREEGVAAREKAVSEREINYKAKIQEEFMTSIRQKLNI